MRHVETYGRIQSGKLLISYKDQFLSAVGNLPDGRVRIRVEKIYRKRSLEQNAYYWGVVIHEFIEGIYYEWGDRISREQAHEMLKKECNNKERVNKRTGEIMKIPQDTRFLTTVEFMEYNDRCIKLIAEYFGRDVALPGEQTELEL